MIFCADCQSIHYPDECRRPAGVAYSVTITYAPFGVARVDIPPPSSPKEPWSDLSKEPDPAGIICRPCSELAHAECEGAERCRCQLCQIMPLIRSLEDDWDLRDKEQSWPTD